MLNRFLKMKEEERGGGNRGRRGGYRGGDGGGGGERRPYIAAECNNVVDAEKYRMQILREVGKKVTEIQNANLGEHRIRDLNDEINRLIREKHHWEKRIIELGGPNYIATAPKVLDHDGKEAAGYGGYKYFGEARNLSGVKDLLVHPGAQAPKRTRYEMYKGVDADYYGFRDDEDGLLETLETEAEKKAISKAVDEWHARQKRKVEDMSSAVPDEFVAHVPVPSKEQLEKMMVDKRKEELMKKYVSAEMAEKITAK